MAIAKTNPSATTGKPGLPKEVVRFLWVASGIFLSWKILYLVWLQPQQTLDKPLVNMLASQTTQLLNTWHTPPNYSFETFEYQQKLAGTSEAAYEGYMARIRYGGKSLLLIVRNCNALELIVLFLGFLVAYPASLRRKLAFAIPGVLAIHGVNVLRCAALVAMANSSYQRFFNFTHHYLFSISIYAFIFLLWYWFARGARPKTATV